MIKIIVKSLSEVRVEQEKDSENLFICIISSYSYFMTLAGYMELFVLQG